MDELTDRLVLIIEVALSVVAFFYALYCVTKEAVYAAIKRAKDHNLFNP